MKILIQMAWRNIWRNKRRALILLCAMTAGLAGVLFCVGFLNGWLDQMLDSAVSRYEGHLKVVGRGYRDNPVVENSFVPMADVEQTLDTDPRVKGWAHRVTSQALLSTAAKSCVVSIVGVDPGREHTVSTVPSSVREGAFPGADDHNRVVIGQGLADKLHLGIGKKIVLMAQQLGGELGSGAFRIAGIFESGSQAFDERHVYILQREAQAMLLLTNRVSETVVMLRAIADTPAVATALRSQVRAGEIEVLTWRELLPFVVETIKMSNRYSKPFLVIFYIAMAFGIVNTLQMAIGERTHEIGVMRAIGMTRGRLVALVMLESLFIAVLAVIVGNLIGCGVVAWYARAGIDLSIVASGMDYLGVGRVLYPRLHVADVAWGSLATFCVSLFFSLFPAVRAARMVPVQAIRQVG